jgi:hypothetical protein
VELDPQRLKLVKIVNGVWPVSVKK